MLNLKEIKDLMKSFEKSSLSKLKISDKSSDIVMEKGGQIQNIASAVAPAQVAAPIPPIAVEQSAPSAPVVAKGDTINSPMVGTYYASPSPEAAAFIKVGDRVNKGQTLCILEAMKIMNEIEAEFDCKIVEILVNDAEPVEYDMPLFVVEKL